MEKKCLSWSRDSKGKIVKRNLRDWSNCLTTMSVSGLSCTIMIVEYE